MGRSARSRLDDRLAQLAAQFGPVAEPEPDPASEAFNAKVAAWTQRAEQTLSPRARSLLTSWLADAAEALDLDDDDERVDGLLRPCAELFVRIHRGVGPSDGVVQEIEHALARA